MTFNNELVTQYLKLLKDHNPIHTHIVPGQLIVEKAFLICKVNWEKYSIKYLQTTVVDEFVGFLMVSESKIIVKNERNEIKITIVKKG